MVFDAPWRAGGAVAEVDATLASAALSAALAAAFARFFSSLSLFSLCRSFFSRFLFLRASASSSVGLGVGTPFKRLEDVAGRTGVEVAGENGSRGAPSFVGIGGHGTKREGEGRAMLGEGRRA